MLKVKCKSLMLCGQIGGYALGTDLKRRLLCMEGAIQNELELE